VNATHNSRPTRKKIFATSNGLGFRAPPLYFAEAQLAASVSHLRNQPNGISDLQNAVARQ